jgi:hypothetical protein
LAQQGVGLRLGQRQLAEEPQHRTGLVQGHTDDVHQEGQHHQDFQTVFAAGRDARDARLVAPGASEDAIANPHGAALFQPPHGPLADQPALRAADPGGIDVPSAFRLGEFQDGRAPAGGFLASSASLPTLGFRIDTVGRGRCLGVGWATAGLAPHLRLILRQSLRKTLRFSFESPDRLPLLVDKIEQLLDRDLPSHSSRSELLGIQGPGIKGLGIHPVPPVGEGAAVANRGVPRSSLGGRQAAPHRSVSRCQGAVKFRNDGAMASGASSRCAACRQTGASSRCAACRQNRGALLSCTLILARKSSPAATFGEGGDAGRASRQGNDNRPSESTKTLCQNGHVRPGRRPGSGWSCSRHTSACAGPSRPPGWRSWRY